MKKNYSKHECRRAHSLIKTQKEDRKPYFSKKLFEGDNFSFFL